jgi:hypothetical protein
VEWVFFTEVEAASAVIAQRLPGFPQPFSLRLIHRIDYRRKTDVMNRLNDGRVATFAKI